MRRDQVSVVCRYKCSADGPWETAFMDWLIGIWFFDFFKSEDSFFPVPCLVYYIKNCGLLLGIEDFWRCVFILELNEDIDFLQLADAWVKDPQRGINLSQGGNISLIGPQLIFLAAESNMKSVTVWMCVYSFLLLLGERWNMEKRM